MQILDRSPHSKILITSQSNYACDEIGVRLLKFLRSNKIYRHYAKRLDNPNTLSEVLFHNSNLGNKKSPNEILEVYNASVVIVTLTTSTKCDLHTHYDHIFIDEAGYATEPEVLIPITKWGMAWNKMKSSVILLGGNFKLSITVV